MSTLSTIAGKNGCGSSNADTGKKGCQIVFGTPLHLIRLPKGTVIDGSEDFNLQYLYSLIQKGIATPLIGAVAFEPLSTEDTMSTTTAGVEQLNLLGLPKYRLSFQEGHEFYRQMSKTTGYKNSDFIIGDDLGNLKIAINHEGNFTGFSAGQVLAELTKEKVQGGDAEMKSLTVQFLNRKQWDEDYTIITSAQLGFDLEDIQGSNPVELSYFSVPAAGDTVLEVMTILASDRDTFVEGLESDDFRVQVNGVDWAISTITEDSVEKTYSLTVPSISSSDEVVTRLYDSTEGTERIISENVIYNSNELTETVV